MSDKKKSLLNISVAVILKIVLLIMAFLVRSALIKILGDEYNGINSLFLSILGVLSIAELGIGTAITFCMYKPIIDANDQKVAALYNLFKKLYRIISAIVLVFGLIFSIFLTVLAKDYSISNIQLYTYFYVFLLSSILSYYCGAKSSLICAYKNNFVATIIYSGSILIQNIIQIVVLFIFKSFFAYLIARVIAVCIQNICLDIYTKKKHKSIISTKNKIDSDTKKDLKKNIGALVLHKITSQIFSSVDSLVISSMFGIILLGKYSNYFLILNSMNEVLKLIFTSLSSIIGQYLLKKDKEESYNFYRFMNSVNIVVGFIFYLGYYSVVNEIISICFGDNLLLEKNLIILLTITYYSQFIRQACANFKDAAGLFYKDRFIVLVAAALNIILSIVLAKFIGISGVIVATLVLVLVIYHPVDSFILHKYQFSKRCYKDLFYKLSSIVLFCGGIFIFNKIDLDISNIYLKLLCNGCISILISISLVLILELKNLKTNIRYLNSFRSIKK